MTEERKQLDKMLEWLETCKETGASYVAAKRDWSGHPLVCNDMAERWLDSYVSERRDLIEWIKGRGEHGLTLLMDAISDQRAKGMDVSGLEVIAEAIIQQRRVDQEAGGVMRESFDMNDLPELTDEERAMMNAMPKDLVDRLWHLQDRVNEVMARAETGGMSVDELTTRLISSNEKLQGITFGIVREAVQVWLESTQPIAQEQASDGEGE